MIPFAKLLEDKTFNRYFTTTPQLNQMQLKRDAWRIWVQRQEAGGWAKKEIRSYELGVRWILGHVEDFHDAALQSRGVAYEPPIRYRKVVRAGQPVLQTGADGIPRPKLIGSPWSPAANLIDEYNHHLWCFYCRRPTVFAWFSNHHIFRGTAMEGYYDASPRRCTLCGITESHNRGRS